MPGIPGNGLISVSNDAINIDTTQVDHPPQVLQNTISTINSSNFITLNMKFLPFEVPIYMNMYFSEVTQLDSNQTRSFRILKDIEPFSDPILPPYGNFTQLFVSNLTVTPNTTFSLVPTPDSTLPPLINALELFITREFDALRAVTNNRNLYLELIFIINFVEIKTIL